MQSTLNPKHPDDPHDILMVAPDAIATAPGDEQLSKVLRDAARHLSDQQSHTPSALKSDLKSDLPAVPPVLSVDTTFRPAAVNVRAPGRRSSMGGWLLRGFTACLLAACTAAAGIAWQLHGETAKQLIAAWVPQLALISSQLTEQTPPPAQPASPAVEADAANASAPQPAPPAETAVEAAAPAAPSPESAQSLQSMRKELASLGQEVELLKATIGQLKAGQQQMSRDAAKASDAKTSDKAFDRAPDQNLRPRKPSPSPPLAAAPVRRPMPPYSPPQAAMAPPLPQAAAAPYVPQAPAPYAPRQYEPPPPAAVQTLADPELTSVPRPPMPLQR
jgi:hypothetical protein